MQRHPSRSNTTSVDPMTSSVDPIVSSGDPIASRFGSRKCSCASKERTCTRRRRVCARLGLPCRRQVAACACPTSPCQVQRHFGRSKTSSVGVMTSSVDPMTGPCDPITSSVDPITSSVDPIASAGCQLWSFARCPDDALCGGRGPRPGLRLVRPQSVQSREGGVGNAIASGRATWHVSAPVPQRTRPMARRTRASRAPQRRPEPARVSAQGLWRQRLRPSIWPHLAMIECSCRFYTGTWFAGFRARGEIQRPAPARLMKRPA